jgi:hypothetical protein
MMNELLSLSMEFEGRLGGEPPAFAALRLLGGLEEIARASLAYRQATVPTPAPTSRPTAGTIAIPPPPPQQTLWSTRSKTYRPALGDPSVIEALLKFKDQAPPIESGPTPPPFRAKQPPAQTRATGGRAKNTLAAPPEIHPARMERFSARDLEPCFPLEPSSKLMRPRE